MDSGDAFIEGAILKMKKTLTGRIPPTSVNLVAHACTNIPAAIKYYRCITTLHTFHRTDALTSIAANSLTV